MVRMVWTTQMEPQVDASYGNGASRWNVPCFLSPPEDDLKDSKSFLEVFLGIYEGFFLCGL